MKPLFDYRHFRFNWLSTSFGFTFVLILIYLFLYLLKKYKTISPPFYSHIIFLHIHFIMQMRMLYKVVTCLLSSYQVHLVT